MPAKQAQDFTPLIERLDNWGACIVQGAIRHRCASAEGRYFNPTAGHWWERPVTPLRRTLDRVDAQVIEGNIAVLGEPIRKTFLHHYAQRYPAWRVRRELLAIGKRVREVEYLAWLDSCHHALAYALDRMTELQKSYILRLRVKEAIMAD
jgi:hypothetical protein